MTGNPTGYDKNEVQIWVNNIEEILESRHEKGEDAFALETVEEQEMYQDIVRHYEAAEDMIHSQGLSEEACYEIEVAHSLIDQLGYELQVRNQPRGDKKWSTIYREEWDEEA